MYKIFIVFLHPYVTELTLDFLRSHMRMCEKKYQSCLKVASSRGGCVFPGIQADRVSFYRVGRN